MVLGNRDLLYYLGKPGILKLTEYGSALEGSNNELQHDPIVVDI